MTEKIVNGDLCPQAENSSSISWVEREKEEVKSCTYLISPSTSEMLVEPSPVEFLATSNLARIAMY